MIKSLIDESHYRTIDIYIYIYIVFKWFIWSLITGPTTHAAMLLEDAILDQLMFRCMLDDETAPAILSS
jgi:hypothetical protein